MAFSIKGLESRIPGNLKKGQEDPLKIDSSCYLLKAIEDLTASKAILGRLISS